MEFLFTIAGAALKIYTDHMLNTACLGMPLKKLNVFVFFVSLIFTLAGISLTVGRYEENKRKRLLVVLHIVIWLVVV